MLSEKVISLLVAICSISSLAGASTRVVHPGQSIQATIMAASPGDRIQVLPGTYHEGSPGSANAITITKNGIQVIGLSTPHRPVVLESMGNQRYGIWVSPPDTTGIGQADEEHPPCAFSHQQIEGFSLIGFTIRGFNAHGVHLACTKGFNLSDNIADGNQVYGLFPIVSQDGVMANNEAKNTQFDAALYIGQSDNVVISGNSAHDNFIGIQLENSRHCTIINNHIAKNTTGILIDSSHGLTCPSSKNNLIAFNEVKQNNAIGILQGTPSGIGILVAAANDTTIINNHIENNNLSGILVSSQVCQTNPSDPTCGDPSFDPTPNHNRIIANTFIKNGTVPNDNPILEFLRADLSWDGTGLNNCWSMNQFETSAGPLPLPSCNHNWLKSY